MDEKFMQLAIEQAKIAKSTGDIPVGCVIISKGKIVGVGYNTREKSKDPLGHAEINAIKMAAENIGDWRLDGCDLYVTLEPCPMCMGAIINARINAVIYGANSKTYGCCGSLINLAAVDFPNRPKIKFGILKSECEKLITNTNCFSNCE
ncbi:MAG: nucleoside deaminase [Oscillospiraceae bacterium]